MGSPCSTICAIIRLIKKIAKMPIRECNSHLGLTIGVPNRPRSKKSIWCQKFVDNVGSGGGAGTLRWGPQAPNSLVHRAKEKLPLFFKNQKFIDDFPLGCQL